jgi:uncharacterized protein (TIGR02246 family)
MNDATHIRHAIAEWGDAFCAKDPERLTALYARDAVSFDAIPPFREGIESMKTKVLQCLPYFPDRFGMETRDLTIHVGGDLAGTHWLWRFTDLPPEHPAGQTWMRSTALWQRRDGHWLIVHDHCSLPFDPETSKAVFTLEP